MNWAAVAKEAGYRSADVCRTRFGQLKRKYNAGRTGTASGGSPAKTIPADETVIKNGSPSKSKKRANPGGISEGQRRTKVKKEEKLKGEEEGGDFISKVKQEIRFGSNKEYV